MGLNGKLNMYILVGCNKSYNILYTFIQVKIFTVKEYLFAKQVKRPAANKKEFP